METIALLAFGAGNRYAARRVFAPGGHESGYVEMTVSTIFVNAEDVRKSFLGGKGKSCHRVEVLKGVSLAVPRGEFISIMGPSGSGKTTLLNCLSGLMNVDSGFISLGDSTLTGVGNRQRENIRRQLAGFVFQDSNLIESLNAIDNVRLPAKLLGKGVSVEDALQLLISLGVSDKAKEYPSSLSGGERQRVAIARAVAMDPAILFADEPTGSLDSKNSRVVMSILRNEARENGRTIFMVTHDLMSASFSDRVVILRDGQIVTDIDHPSVHDISSAMEAYSC